MQAGRLAGWLGWLVSLVDSISKDLSVSLKLRVAVADETAKREKALQQAREAQKKLDDELFSTRCVPLLSQQTACRVCYQIHLFFPRSAALCIACCKYMHLRHLRGQECQDLSRPPSPVSGVSHLSHIRTISSLCSMLSPSFVLNMLGKCRGDLEGINAKLGEDESTVTSRTSELKRWEYGLTLSLPGLLKSRITDCTGC